MSTPRPGGRSAIVKAKVFDAAQTLAVDKGLHNVTMPDIAKLAGVAPTSLYRRWGDVGTLLMEMAVERLSEGAAQICAAAGTDTIDPPGMNGAVVTVSCGQIGDGFDDTNGWALILNAG